MAAFQAQRTVITRLVLVLKRSLYNVLNYVGPVCTGMCSKTSAMFLFLKTFKSCKSKAVDSEDAGCVLETKCHSVEVI